MEALGKQILIELYGCDAEQLKKVEEVEAAMLAFARESRATIISSHFHQFNPVGVSGVILIKESHFTIHTWPEYQYAAVDVFTCGDEMDLERGLVLFKEILQPSTVELKEVARGKMVFSK
ncbi:MAG: adenosylmethionine decarboxylase [Bacteroidetes bacterium]|nr:adenosylmethionine decarboxylase [Bacteroidota bacterium]